MEKVKRGAMRKSLLRQPHPFALSKQTPNPVAVVSPNGDNLALPYSLTRLFHTSVAGEIAIRGKIPVGPVGLRTSTSKLVH